MQESIQEMQHKTRKIKNEGTAQKACMISSKEKGKTLGKKNNKEVGMKVCKKSSI